MQIQNPKILIIDDTASVRLAISFILRNEGFSVIEAVNGSDGRGMAGIEHPDLILLDVEMPGENGIETCRKLKANVDTNDIPVIFLTANDNIETKIAGFEVGATDYITKPYHRLEVLARVRTHIRLNRELKQLFELQRTQALNLVDAQRALLPLPELIPEAQFGVAYHPLCGVGGDIYDVLPLGNGNHDYYIADVSGHDQGSAIPTASLQALFRQNADIINRPLEIFNRMNKILVGLFGEGIFATSIHVRLLRKSKRAIITNAAHLSPIKISNGHAEFITLEESDVLGAFTRANYTELVISVQPGDRILLYSDGLIEASKSIENQTLSSSEQLLQLAQSTSKMQINVAVAKIYEQLLKEVIQTDDVLLVGIDV